MGAGPELPAPTEVRIESLAAGGRGLGRVEGLVWLVEGAVPGDLVLAVPRSRGPRVVEARTERRIEDSTLRRPAPCPIQERCGGCAWMVLDEKAQREWKRRLVADALERIGGFEGIEVEPPIPSPLDLGYRNKVELTLGLEGAERALGYRPAGDPETVVDVERCLLQSDAGNRALSVLRSFFLEGPGRGASLRIVLRRSAQDRMLVALRGPGGALPGESELVRALVDRVPELHSVVRIVAQPDRRGGAVTRALWGPPWLDERIAGLDLRLPASTFFQVNPGAAELLAEVVAELAGALEGARVLELYGGVGVFSLMLVARGARDAVVCDADPEAIECGRRAAAHNGDLRVSFVRSDVGRFLGSYRGRPSIVITDPPRSGLGRGVAAAIAATRAERVILVSCDPATLARDARALAAAGYAPRRVVPVDLFPQTPHVEVVVGVKSRHST